MEYSKKYRNYLRVIVTTVSLLFALSSCNITQPVTEKYVFTNNDRDGFIINKINVSRISKKGYPRQYTEEVIVLFRCDSASKFPNKVYFNKKNKNCYWEYVGLSDFTKYETLPFEFEKDSWYSIRDILYKGEECTIYLYFDSDKKLTFFINEDGGPF